MSEVGLGPTGNRPQNDSEIDFYIFLKVTSAAPPWGGGRHVSGGGGGGLISLVLNRIPPKIPRRASRAGFPLYPLCMFNRIPLKTFPVRNKTPENPRRASRAGFPLYSLCILSRVPLEFPRRAKRAGIFRNITNSGKCSGIHRKFFPGNAPAFSENVNIFRKCPVNSYMNFSKIIKHLIL